MSWRTNRAVLAIRNLGRRLGINHLVGRSGQGGYEDAYRSALMSAIRVGDTVWDVGANVGYYTSQFARLVGVNGRVVAFEPSKTNFMGLKAACGKLANVHLCPYGLGDVRGVMRFAQGCDELGATSRVVTNDEGSEVIEISVGDELLAQGAVPQPDVIKIDVEGFEVEVIRGLNTILARTKVRLLGIEVHFAILESRGLAAAPREIEATLKGLGFSVRWPDRSHVVATRQGAM